MCPEGTAYKHLERQSKMILLDNRCTLCFPRRCIDRQGKPYTLKLTLTTESFRNCQEDNSETTNQNGIRMSSHRTTVTLPNTAYLAPVRGFGPRVVVVRPRRASFTSSIRRGPSVRVVRACRALGAGSSRRGTSPIVVGAGGALHASRTRSRPDADAVRACSAGCTSGDGGRRSVGVVSALRAKRAHTSTTDRK